MAMSSVLRPPIIARVSAMTRVAVKPMSIKLKVALGTTALWLVLIGLLIALELASMRRDFARVLADQQTLLVARAAEDLDNKLSQSLDALSRSAANLPVSLADSPAKLRAFYGERPAVLALFDDLLLIDNSGQVIADLPALPGRTQVNVADRQFFQRVLATGRPVISDPLLSSQPHEPIIDMAVPVRSEDGRIVAVLTGVLRLQKSNILGDFATAKVGRTGYFFLFT